MSTENNYIFKSERLGFRAWSDSDIDKMAEINADPEVMKFFPATSSITRTIDFIERMKHLLDQKGFCYFSVDKLEDGKFIGFIGLAEQRFEAEFNPCIDIGWRLDRAEWRQGYATEGAKRCLQYAFQELKLKKINAIAPEINLRSIQIMERIGMKRISTFKHPFLAATERLQTCVLYEIRNETPLNID